VTDEEPELRLERAFLAVDRLEVERVVTTALAGARPDQVLEQVVVPALDRVGRAWEAGAASLSQVYMAGRMTEDLLGRLLPQAMPQADRPRVVLGVLEDQHVLGKRMVHAYLAAGGLSVLDLGAGLTAAALAERTAGEGAAVLMVSTLMIRSALRVQDVVEALRARGCAAAVVVGGAPFRLDPALWRRVGADAWGASASEAPGLALRLGRRP
jgi:methanogenic corrinoid protein MtbC1